MAKDAHSPPCVFCDKIDEVGNEAETSLLSNTRVIPVIPLSWSWLPNLANAARSGAPRPPKA
jgi:hypothetical protein